MNFKINCEPNLEEITSFYRKVFHDLEFPEQESQDLEEWIDLKAMILYGSQHGRCIEGRDENGLLVAGAFIGKQNSITWPDGNKAELFIMGVSFAHRKKSLGSELLATCEKVAKEFGAKKVIVNTHVLLADTIRFYKKNNYVEAGILKDYYGNGDAVFLIKDL